MGTMAMVVVVMVVWAVITVGVAAAGNPEAGGSIGFASLNRLSMAFDVYTLNLQRDRALIKESRVTLGESVSYNAQLVQADKGSALLKRLKQRGDHTVEVGDEESEFLVYVSEVEGMAQLYLDLPLQGKRPAPPRPISKLRVHCSKPQSSHGSISNFAVQFLNLSQFTVQRQTSQFNFKTSVISWFDFELRVSIFRSSVSYFKF